MKARALPAAALLLAAALAPAAEGPPAPAAPAPAPALLLRGGTVLTMAGDPIPDGGVLVRDGKIVSVGRALPAPEGAVVVDCAGGFVVPGFIDASTRVGLVDIDLVKAANDGDEGTAPSTPDVDVRDGVNVDSPVFGVTRSRGVTTVLVRPQDSNAVNGLGAVFHCLDGAPLSERTVLAPSGLHLSLGGPPKERFAKKDEMPATRMGTAAVIRREFDRAVDYREKWRRHREKDAARKEGEESPAPPDRDRGLDVLVSALAGEIPVFVRAERLDDLRTALRLADEYRFRLVLEGATESWKMAKELAERKIPVVLGPVTAQPDSPERPGARMDAARILREAGVLFCLMTGDAHNSRNLPVHAGIAASWGLPAAHALEAITRDAARVLGLDATLGSLAPGKEATLCVFRGPPLEPTSRLERMYVRGREVPLRNRQTELLERWK